MIWLSRAYASRQHADGVGTGLNSTEEYWQSRQNMVTLLLYLTDTVEGGKTVFPNLGMAVAPQKGSLNAYFNYRSDLSGDSRATHQGCPVVSGHKWIATKWVRWIPQMFKTPCHKNMGQHIYLEQLWKQIKQII